MRDYNVLKFNDEGLTEFPLLFLHIPKTGGTTFRKILESQYTRVINGATTPETDKAVIHSISHGVYPEVICGHFDFTAGLYNTKMLRDRYSNITLLRDPVERAISQIYYLKNRPDHAYYQEIKNMPISEIFRTPRTITRFAVKDLQIHLLSGHISYAGSSGTEIRDARQCLQKNFTFFGFTEDMEGFVLLCQDRFGWDTDVIIPRLNAAPENRNGELSLSNEDMHIIKVNNRREIDFFKYAQDLYQERYAGRVNELKAEVAKKRAEAARIEAEKEEERKALERFDKQRMELKRERVIRTKEIPKKETYWQRVKRFLGGRMRLS